MKPPFSYYGGKQRIVRHIIPHIPQHTIYVEPFCGAATLLFAKPNLKTGNNDDYREVINDIDNDILNFFNQLKYNGSELCRLLELSLFSQEEHRKAKNYKDDDELLKAYYFYINIMQSFSNIKNGSWGIAKFSKNLSETYKNKTETLKNYIERMRSIFISSEDALTCIKRWDSPQTFFYCDPPYPDTYQDYVKKFTQNNLNELIETLNNCEGSFILSCYNNDAVPHDWKKIEIETVCSCSNTAKNGHREKRIECLWIREAKGVPRKEILQIYEKQKQLKFI